MKIYIDGKYYSREEATVSVFDHAFLYGDGVFEGIRIYNGKIFKLDEHVKRLFESAKAISLEIGMNDAEMKKALLESVAVNEKENGYIRLVVSRGDGNLGIDPANCPKAKVVIIVGDIQLYPKDHYEKGIEIIVSSYRRVPVQCFDPRIKSLNYLNNALAKIEARSRGCMESVMLNTDGFVAECTADNIFIVKNGVLKTPAGYHGALEGITRNVVLELAGKEGVHSIETTLTRFDLLVADECFLTGTGAEIIPVVKIDGTLIGNGKPGEITGKLIEGFKKLY